MADDGKGFVPDQVRRQIKAGEEAYQRLKANGQDQTPSEPPQDDPSPPEPPQDDPSPPEPSGDQPPAHVEPTSDQYAKLMQLHRTLQGRYNKLLDDNRRAQDEHSRQLGQLQQQITELTTRLVAENTRIPANVPAKKLLTPLQNYGISEEQLRDYGPQIFETIRDMASAIADEVVATRLGELGPQVEKLTSRVESFGTDAQAQRGVRFHQWMDNNVTGWREQDDDPLFLAWLREEDQFSGVPRMQILGQAINSENYARVKLIYEGYVAEQDAIAPPSAHRRAAPNSAAPARTRMGAIVAPGGGRGRTAAVTPNNAPEAPVTGAMIADYFARKRRGQLTQAEIDTFERRMAGDLASGRVRSQPRY